MKGDIFRHSFIDGIKLNNRIIRSATHEGLGDENGRPHPELKDLYVKLASGEAGAIITGVTGVSRNGKLLSNMLMIDTDDYLDNYREITDAVHQASTPVIMQLVHAGRQTDKAVTGGLQPVAPSAIRDRVYFRTKPAELSDGEIEEIITDFIEAIDRAQKAGFDGVQLHCAHGFLLSQFLSPYMNRRKDKWGGSTENRFRIIKEIIKGAKEKFCDFPILAKINACDGRRGGVTVNEAAATAQLLEQAGCSAIEISCGISEDSMGLFTVRSESPPVDAIISMMPGLKDINRPLKKTASFVISQMAKSPRPFFNYNVQAAKAIKSKVNIPVIVVGGIKRLPDIETIIENRCADFVSMARPFIIEPDIVKKFRTGRSTESGCISCSHCFFGSVTGPLACYYGRL